MRKQHSGRIVNLASDSPCSLVGCNRRESHDKNVSYPRSTKKATPKDRCRRLLAESRE